MMARFHAGIRLIAPAFILLAGCERPKPLNTIPVVPPPVIASGDDPPQGSASSAKIVPTPLAIAPLLRPAATVIREYREQSDPEKRRELIWELTGASPAEGVSVVGQMLETEKRATLRVELFDALDGFHGEESRKIAILKRELLEQRTVGEPYEAAIDALLNIQHRDAIPVWQALSENAEDELRDVARDAIKALETLK